MCGKLWCAVVFHGMLTEGMVVVVQVIVEVLVVVVVQVIVEVLVVVVVVVELCLVGLCYYTHNIPGPGHGGIGRGRKRNEPCPLTLRMTH